MSSVEDTIPPITTVASGRCTSAPAPTLIAIGTKPRLATRAVIRTGRSRVRAPSRIASPTGLPSWISDLMKVTITTPFSTATPDRAMKPTPAEIDSGMPRAASASTPPVSASGTPLKTTSASRNEPNAMNSSARITASVSGTTSDSRWLAEANCSNVPP
mgnify:CR=1 FL=1